MVYIKTKDPKYTCNICGYSWKTRCKNLLKDKPRACAKRGCRSKLWNRDLSDSKRYTYKRYFQTAIKARYNNKGCLIALGNKRGKHKYHKISREGRQWLLHRWVFFYYYGYEPSCEVMHLCNNTSCINPLHLKSGDHKENERYKVECGRSLKGEKNSMSKLNRLQVLYIKKCLKNYKEGMISMLANKYKVTNSAILAIKSGRNWR